jgi:hypothetical protein
MSGSGLAPMPAGDVSPPAPWWIVAIFLAFMPVFIVQQLLKDRKERART